MAEKRIGKQTIQFMSVPKILSWGTVVGPKEGKGPLKDYFDIVMKNNLDEVAKSWEETEQRMMQHSIELALEKGNLLPDNLDYYIAGDLLNQITCANFTARFLSVPFFGIYGACSTLVEGLALASILLDGGFASKVGISASSHHDTAERQLRFPTEMGVQRPMTAQWTVTGAGSYIIQKDTKGVMIPFATIGKIKDKGITNANDMGTAMATAAYNTIVTHLEDLGRKIEDYDLIITGDLGKLGLNILIELLQAKGYDTQNVSDCGILVYDLQQDTHTGGSGCGCSAVVLSYLLNQLIEKKYKRIFIVGTGALLSPTTANQGETIPSIAHGVVLEYL